MTGEIERLKQRVNDIREENEKDRLLHKKRPNELMVENTPDFIESYDFWCSECEEDFDSPAYKTIHRLYGDPIVCYRTRHSCGNECVRLVSHRDHDQYYQLSEKIRRQRNEYARDALQADEYGFRANYGNPYAEFEKNLIEKEEKIIQNERDKGLKGLSLEAQQKLAKLKNG